MKYPYLAVKVSVDITFGLQMKNYYKVVSGRFNNFVEERLSIPYPDKISTYDDQELIEERRQKRIKTVAWAGATVLAAGLTTLGIVEDINKAIVMIPGAATFVSYYEATLHSAKLALVGMEIEDREASTIE